MRFQRLDLNLLVALDALLSERSVSIAADRLCLSQSATSSALGRLRDYFEDELLVLKGRQMVLTSRAEELVEPVAAVLEQIQKTIAVTPPFDPASDDRLIRIMASDYVTEVLLTKVLAQLEAEAPHMRFELQAIVEQPIIPLERRQVDLLISIDYAISSDHPSQILFEDDHVVIGWSGNPALNQPMTRELYFELGHVTARFSSGRVPAFEEWFVRRQRQARRIEVAAPTFLSLPSLLTGTGRIATVHRRLAQRIAARAPLVVRELPFEMPRIREAIQWSLSNNGDQALRWVADRIVAIAADSPTMDTGMSDDRVDDELYRAYRNDLQDGPSGASPVARKARRSSSEAGPAPAADSQRKTKQNR